jgi:hypothetical protein
VGKVEKYNYSKRALESIALKIKKARYQIIYDTQILTPKDDAFYKLKTLQLLTFSAHHLFYLNQNRIGGYNHKIKRNIKGLLTKEYKN